MMDRDYVPELYTERDIVKARRRHRLVGRIEGAATVIGLGVLWNFLPWVTGALLVAAVGTVIYKLVSKPKPGAPDA
jgi:hypothetical protein